MDVIYELRLFFIKIINRGCFATFSAKSQVFVKLKEVDFLPVSQSPGFSFL